MEKMQNREKRLNFVLSLIVVLIYIFPFYILINVSLRNYTDLSSRLLPTVIPQATNYIKLFSDSLFWKAGINTILYCLLTVGILIPLASLGGYGLARSECRLTKAIQSLNIMTMMIPATALLVGTYSLMVKLKLTNSILGLALLSVGGSMTSVMFFYTTFTTMIPKELDEAAAIDGAGIIRTYYQIIFPQLKAVTITRVIDCITVCWNNYLMPMYMLSKSEKYTLILYIKKLYSSWTKVSDIPLAFAGCVLMIAPILIFYFLMQKHIIGGQIDSSVKG